MKIITKVGFKYRMQHFGIADAIKGIFTGAKNFDTAYAKDFWTFKRGIQYDYTNMRIPTLELIREDDGWSINPMIKPEGRPINYNMPEFEGLVVLGTWWTVKFDMRKFHVYFRYRSWTKNIFYVAWD